MTHPNPAPNGWRQWVMGALLLGLTMLIGVGIDEQRRAVQDLRLQLRRLEDIIAVNSNRLSRLEETRDFQQRQLDRIEKGVEDLIVQHVKVAR